MSLDINWELTTLVHDSKMFVSRCSLAINASEIIKLLVDPRLHVLEKFYFLRSQLILEDILFSSFPLLQANVIKNPLNKLT